MEKDLQNSNYFNNLLSSFINHRREMDNIGYTRNISGQYFKNRWEHFLSQNDSGNVLIEGVDIKDLVEKYGSSLFVLVEEEIRKKCREFRDGLNYPFLKLQYACKCNSNLEILNIIREEGWDMDASSIGEIILGLLAGFKPSQISFTNLYKTEKDILFAISVGVESIILDSLEELDLVIDVSKKTNQSFKIMLRINPLIKDGKFSTKQQQHGIPYTDASRAIAIISQNSFIKLKGFHYHGSYAHGPNSYFMAVQKLVDLVILSKQRGIVIEALDLGGGFPVEYPKAYCPGRYFSPKSFGEDFIPKFRDLCIRKQISEPRLIFEPGKAIVANSGIGIVRVISKKTLEDKEIVVTDGSCYSMFPDILISHCDYEILPGSKMNSKPLIKYDIAGSTCDCLDIIAAKRIMPQLEKGDLLLVMDCGAYSNVLSSNFNNLKKPPIIMINNRGETKLVRRRDKYGEIFGPELDMFKMRDKNLINKFNNILKNIGR